MSTGPTGWPYTITQCAHDEIELRRRVQSNGVEVVMRQCLGCGGNRGNVKKSSVSEAEYAALPEWDETWKERQQAGWEARQAAFEAARAEEQRQWREFYDAYLLSDAWAARRRQVLDRAEGLCEGCGERRATQVHHLTYAHLGDEFLWELKAVCRACHTRLHGVNEPTMIFPAAAR